MELYNEAANVVKNVLSKTDSLKSLVFSSKIQNKKALYALSCESLKYRKVLQEIIDRCGKLNQEKFLVQNQHLGIVLMYEHLLGKGIKGKCGMYFKRHKFVIHTQCELMKIRAGVTDIRQLVEPTEERTAVPLPKYVRINTLLTSVAEAQQQFVVTHGYDHVDCDADSFRDVVSCLESQKFTTDPLIPNLLVFPPNTDFHDMQLYKSGNIIVQDKASCIPAYILSPPAGTSVIDCCAAPGNKTSHLASIIGNKGTVYAFDKSKKRLATLRQQMQKAGVTCVTAECRDFLTVDPCDGRYRDVEYILVDPSCSGSGMINRVLQHTEEEDSHSVERLAQLSKFQISILKHALSFPKVKKVVYSTCSVHEQENEQVVEEVLSSYCDRFKLKLIMPEWSHRGLQSFSVGKFCVRMSHEEALTNGFFVACFERLEIEGSLENALMELEHGSVPAEQDLNICKKNKKSDNADEDFVKRKKKKTQDIEDGNCSGNTVAEKVSVEHCLNVHRKITKTHNADFVKIKKKRKKTEEIKGSFDGNCAKNALLELDHEINSVDHGLNVCNKIRKTDNTDDDVVEKMRRKKKKANACKKKRKKNKERKQ